MTLTVRRNRLRASGRPGAAPADGPDGTDGRWHIARPIAGNRVISTWIRRPGT